MDTECIKGKVRGFFSKFIGGVEISDNEELFSSGLVNSLFAMQLVLFIEKEFALKVEDEDLDLNNFHTVESIAGFILRKQSKI